MECDDQNIFHTSKSGPLRTSDWGPSGLGALGSTSGAGTGETVDYRSSIYWFNRINLSRIRIINTRTMAMNLYETFWSHNYFQIVHHLIRSAAFSLVSEIFTTVTL